MKLTRHIYSRLTEVAHVMWKMKLWPERRMKRRTDGKVKLL